MAEPALNQIFDYSIQDYLKFQIFARPYLKMKVTVFKIFCVLVVPSQQRTPHPLGAVLSFKYN